MPRGPLSPDHKAKMQQARKTTDQDRDAALAILESNHQFTHPKLWSRVSAELQEGVLKAIRKAQRGAKLKQIAQMQARIEKIQATL